MSSLSLRQQVENSPCGEENSSAALRFHLPNSLTQPLKQERGQGPSKETGYILLIFGSGFFTDVPGEALEGPGTGRLMRFLLLRGKPRVVGLCIRKTVLRPGLAVINPGDNWARVREK